MKLSHTVAAVAAVHAACALSILRDEQAVLQPLPEGTSEAASSELYLIELAPGKTMQVTEEDKWDLRRVGILTSDA